MARYEYAGPGPHDDGQGGIVRPGDVRDFAAEPSWGPWRLLDEPAAPETSEKPSEPPPTPTPAPAPASVPTPTTAPPGPKTGE